MAFYLRSRLPHLRHAAVSLTKTQILPQFSSPGGGIFMFRRLEANEMGSCSQKVSEVDDCVNVEMHASLKTGKSRTPVKGKNGQSVQNAVDSHASVKGKMGRERKSSQVVDNAVESAKKGKMGGNGKRVTISKLLELIAAANKGESRKIDQPIDSAVESHASVKTRKMVGNGKIGQPIDSAVESHASVKTRKMVGNGKGYQNIENDAKPLVFVEKGKLREHKKWLKNYLKKLAETTMESIAPIYPAPVHDFVRRLMNEKKEMAKWDVMKLCKQKRVYDIVKFPPEVLRSNRRLYQLFEAWMIENEIRYKSKSEKMWRFEDFKYNVFLNDEVNECSTGKSRRVKARLGLDADYKPGMIPIVDCRQHYDSF